MRMSFLTDVTPLMPLASCTAWCMAAEELTNPLSCTAPLNVSTLTSLALTSGSSTSAAFTLVVIQESETYSPVLSCVALPAQPRAEAKATARNRAHRRLNRFMTDSFQMKFGKPLLPAREEQSVRSRTYPEEELI